MSFVSDPDLLSPFQEYGKMNVGNFFRTLILGGNEISFQSTPFNNDIKIGSSIKSNSAILPNVWTHIAVTYDKASKLFRMYINGVVDVFGNFDLTINNTSRNLWIGGQDGSYSPLQPNGPHLVFSGYIDEVKIYNYARSAEQIANDAGKQPYTLTVIKSGTGSGTVTSTPLGINCGSTCSASFISVASVTLTAVADVSSTFTGWSGDCSGSQTNCTVVIDSNKNVMATFTREASSGNMLSLNQGWNLISLPIQPSDTAIATVSIRYLREVYNSMGI